MTAAGHSVSLHAEAEARIVTMLATAPSGHDVALCIPDLRTRKKEAVLAEMAGAAHGAGVVADSTLLVEILKLRERLGSTAVGKGVALPQARSITVLMPRLVVARSLRGVEWGAEDGAPVNLVLLVLAPAEWSDDAYHGLISRAASPMRLQRTRQKLIGAESLEVLNALWREATS